MSTATQDNKPKFVGLFNIKLKVDELSEKLGKGIPKSSVGLIEGPEGSGRSVLSQRICYGLLFNGASVTYISTEMTMKDFIDQMYSLGYRIDRFLITGKLRFIPVYPIMGQLRSRENFLNRLMDSEDLFATDATIIDTLSAICYNRLTEDKSVQLMSFLKKVVSRGKLVIMSIEQDLQGAEPLRLAADLYFGLNTRLAPEGIRRTISVKRFTKAQHNVDDVIRYRIEPKSGLVIELTEVSG
jgi:flagellar protein FlaH